MSLLKTNPLKKYYEQTPIILIDIGASGGLQNHWKKLANYLSVIGFEPDHRSFSDLGALKNPGEKSRAYLSTALYKEKTNIPFYFTRKKEVSSIFKPNRALLNSFPNPERFDIMENTFLSADTLDAQCSAHAIGDVDFIKIDTQGSELFILQGADNILNTTVFGLEVEVEFVPLYEKQPLFAEVDSYVRGFGFQLFDLKQRYWKRTTGNKLAQLKGQITYADALYLKELDSFGKILEPLAEDEIKKSKILRAILICVYVYGYLDYAVELFKKYERFFEAKEREILMKELTEAHRFSPKINYYKARQKISITLKKFFPRV